MQFSKNPPLSGSDRVRSAGFQIFSKGNLPGGFIEINLHDFFESAENARTENARLENAAPYCKGGKCRTGKRGNDEV